MVYSMWHVWKLSHAVRPYPSRRIFKLRVNDINRGTHERYGSIINEIKLRATTLNCQFTFEGRAANTYADRLAKFSHSLD